MSWAEVGMLIAVRQPEAAWVDGAEGPAAERAEPSRHGYDPGLQRWLTPDPIGLAGGLNLYGFVGNNPVNFVDPYGLDFRATGAYGLLTPGPLAYVAGDTALENFAAGVYNTFPLAANVTAQTAGSLLTAMGLASEAVREAARQVTEMAGGSAAEAELVGSFAQAAASILVPLRRITPCPVLRVKPSPHIIENAARGNAFESRVLAALGAARNTAPVSALGGRAIPDLVEGGITEIKDVVHLSFTRQLRIEAAASEGPFNLIVSPRTQTVSRPLQDAVRNSGGSIRVFDPATGTFRPC